MDFGLEMCSLQSCLCKWLPKCMQRSKKCSDQANFTSYCFYEMMTAVLCLGLVLSNPDDAIVPEIMSCFRFQVKVFVCGFFPAWLERKRGLLSHTL